MSIVQPIVSIVVNPRGAIYGWKHKGDGSSPKELGPASVGQSSCTNKPGSY